MLNTFRLSLILLMLFGCSNTSKAQNNIITKYFDSSWIPVAKEAAFYRAVFEKKDAGYGFNSYWVSSGKLQSKTIYADTTFAKPIGLMHKFYQNGQTADSILFYPDHTLSTHYRFYETGVLEYKMVYGRDGNMDEADHYYPDGKLFVNYRDKKGSPAVVKAFNDDGSLIPGFNYGNLAEMQDGGDAGWKAFLAKNIKPKVPVKKGAPVGTYKVMVQFAIDTLGNVTDVFAETNFGYGMEEEAIRVIKKSPKWIPGVYLGKKIKARRRQPVTFVVEEK